MKYILSYGGGVNSSALFFYLIDNHKPLDLVIFSDTGEELPQTYDAVKRMEIVCRAYKITFVTVKSHLGKLYDYHFKRRLVPSIMRRDCTGKFKVAPIRRYIRERYGKEERFTIYIGIAWDEVHRMSDSNVKYITHSFPFIEDNIDRKENEAILKKFNFKAEKSGCVGCPYIGKNGYTKLHTDDREQFNRWMALELNNKRYPEITLVPGLKLKSLDEGLRTQTKLTDIPDWNSCGDCAGGCFL